MTDPSNVTLMALAMLATGLAFLYLIWFRRDRTRSLDLISKLGIGLSIALVVTSAALLLLANSDPPGGSSVPASGVATAVEDVQMDVEAEDLSFLSVDTGLPGTLVDYQGDVLLVNFWATWCAPCLTEMPELSRLHANYADQGVKVIAVSDEQLGTLRGFFDMLPVNAVKVRVEASTTIAPLYTQALQVRPTTFIIDRNGTIRRYIVGARDYRFFERAIQPYL